MATEEAIERVQTLRKMADDLQAIIDKGAPEKGTIILMPIDGSGAVTIGISCGTLDRNGLLVVGNVILQGEIRQTHTTATWKVVTSLMCLRSQQAQPKPPPDKREQVNSDLSL